MFGVVLEYVMSIHLNGFIAVDDACPAYFGDVHAPSVHVAFGEGHKECSSRLLFVKQTSKIDVSAMQRTDFFALVPLIFILYHSV